VDTLRWLVNLARLSASSANLQPLIAFAENSFLNEGEWVSRESFQGTGCLIAMGPIHDP